jgi:hypothetical protein
MTFGRLWTRWKNQGMMIYKNIGQDKGGEFMGEQRRLENALSMTIHHDGNTEEDVLSI